MDRVAAGPSDPDRPTVLLVDDDRSSLDLMAAYLEDTSARLEKASDGTEAIRLAQALRPDVVVLDIRLPRLDGWQVMSALRADVATVDIPIVVTTVVDDRARGLALGAQEYLLKPVRREDLLAALARVGVPRPRGRAAHSGVAMIAARILVIEDNPLNLKLVRDVLGAVGYEVVSATSGEEGLAVAAELPPALVLMDLQLPGIDGFETMRLLRDRTPSTRRSRSSPSRPRP